MVDEHCITEFRAAGVAVLRGFFDPGPLAEEMDRALSSGLSGDMQALVGSVGNEFRYVPMMCDETPVSLGLLDALAEPAADLLGRDVVPTRAKGTRYAGDTAWHRDSDTAVASIGFAGYLEALDVGNGALRVLKGSHRSTALDPPTGGSAGDHDPAGEHETVGDTIATSPGDIIAFDEHLWHSSAGGRNRRQWRVDFVVDPVTIEEERLVRTYFASIFRPGWDGGYDVDRYPSFGDRWMRSDRPWTGRLDELGVYALAHDEEEWVRNRRRETHVRNSDS